MSKVLKAYGLFRGYLIAKLEHGCSKVPKGIGVICNNNAKYQQWVKWSGFKSKECTRIHSEEQLKNLTFRSVYRIKGFSDDSLFQIAKMRVRP